MGLKGSRGFAGILGFRRELRVWIGGSQRYGGITGFCRDFKGSMDPTPCDPSESPRISLTS